MKGKLVFFDLGKMSKAETLKLLRDYANRGFKGGVYFFINKVDGKMYVGSSVNLVKRITNYPDPYVKGQSKIHKALLKYGLSGFDLIVLALSVCSRELY